jgi:hypothetical protein
LNAKGRGQILRKRRTPTPGILGAGAELVAMGLLIEHARAAVTKNAPLTSPSKGNLPMNTGPEIKIALMMNVRPGDVSRINVREVRQLLEGRIDPDVIEVATDVENFARFWRVGSKVFLDDPDYEGPIAFEDLRYDSSLGLHSIKQF